MAGISSPGIGSGIDIAGLVNKLVAAERQPEANRLDTQETGLQARISALGSLKGVISDFQTKLAALSQISTYQARKVSVSNSSAFSASASSSAVSGQYTLNISQLAQTQTLVTDPASPFANTTDPVGEGTLTFRFGTDPVGSFVQNTDKGTYNINIDSSNNSLQGIRDAINEADIGVQASIVNNGSGYLLSITSADSGAANSLEITVTDTGDGNNTDTSGLSQLAYNSSAANLAETVSAQDAQLTINGISIDSSSNTVTSAIDGVTINLLDAQSGTLNVSQDQNSVKNAITDFVSSYNSLMSTINDLTSYDVKTKKAGILNGDAGTRNIVNRMRNLISTIVPGLSGPFSSLAGLGITTTENGTLTVDSTKLDNALSNYFDDVAGLFSVVGKPSDALVKYLSATDSTKAGEYDVAVNSLATQGVINGNGTTVLADDGSGNFTSPVVIDTNNDNFSIKIDGKSSGTISLTQGSYATASELAAELQTRINSDSTLADNGISATVSFDSTNDRFIITSDRYGSSSSVAFDSVDTNTASDLGFDTGLVGTDGTDVSGTIGGVAATGDGQYLIGAGDASGLKVSVVGGSTGSRGTISFTRGVGDQLNSYINSLLDNKLIDDRISSLQKDVDRIGGDRDRLAQRMDLLQQQLMAKFNAMDTLVAKLNSTSSYLAQQLGGSSLLSSAVNLGK